MEQDQEQLDIFDPVKVDDKYFAEHYEEQEAFYMQLKKLPYTVVDILFGIDTPEIIRSIAAKYRLNENQSVSLSRLIRKLLSVEIYLGDITVQVKERLTVNETVAKSIASSIISDLFASALEDLKKLHVEKFGKRADQTAPTQPATNINNPNNLVNLRGK